jgi:polyadenylate-binding protein
MERFRNRQERVEVLGNKMKMFNNLFFKNFGDEMSEDEMKRMFEPYRKLVSVKVKF